MATKLTSNRRALGDISNRRQNHAPKVVKVHRPITRKFGAGIAHDQLQHGQDTENLVTQRSKERGHVCEREKVKAARVDGESLIDDNPVKKFAENRECDYSSESSMSIETDDFHEESDSQIMSCVPADYMSTQTDINHRMRAVLVDWLIEVHLKFDLMHETLFLAINLVDRYLSRQGVTRKFLQLVGITGMLIACKYEEIFPPQLSDFIAISAGAYAREDVLKMEKSMLNTLQFNMSTPTPFVFMRRFLKVAESDNKLEMVSFYLLELCLVDYQTLRFPPSLVSAAAIYTGRCLLRMTPSWNSNLRHHCTYTEDQLQECGRAIEDIHRNAGLGKLTAVYRKYAIAKYSCVATLMKNC
ncbi:G2/mitotic-specific cyclin S13-7-like isoform X2 [Aristolochia californica]|uniref:G2/mitotic-specific cyclin S13-7-like isoform X2 n=1 Tax=Aristolochia californica TaxID=171875 RepID=UPI0035DE7509